MAPNVGNFSIQELLAARFPFTNQGPYSYAEVTRSLQADINAHNAVMQDMLREFCDLTTERQLVFGSGAAGEMVEVDEFGKAPTQNVLPGATVAFPLRLFQLNVGFTNTWLKAATVADVAMKVQNAESAHKRAVIQALRKAIFESANYTFIDRLVDNVSLACKRFINADSAAIPTGPNGETFDPATHQHYVGAAGAVPTQAELESLIENVVEHGHGSAVKLAITKGYEAAFNTLVGTAFTAYVDPRITLGSASATANGNLDISRLDNRAIGIFHGAEVWVKSWVPTGFSVAYEAGGTQKPLAFRQRNATTLQGLRLAYENDGLPLHTQYMEAEFGIAANTRSAAACLDHDAGGGAYTNPVW